MKERFVRVVTSLNVPRDSCGKVLKEIFWGQDLPYDCETLLCAFLKAWYATPPPVSNRVDAAIEAVKALGLNPAPDWSR